MAEVRGSVAGRMLAKIDLGEWYMAKLTNLLKSDLGLGVAIGLGIGAIGAGLAPRVRPIAKESVKYGILLMDKGRQWAGEAYDSFNEIVTGVRTSLNEENRD